MRSRSRDEAGPPEKARRRLPEALRTGRRGIRRGPGGGLTSGGLMVGSRDLRNLWPSEVRKQDLKEV